jgi:hypothetical protein
LEFGQGVSLEQMHSQARLLSLYRRSHRPPLWHKNVIVKAELTTNSTAFIHARRSRHRIANPRTSMPSFGNRSSPSVSTKYSAPILCLRTISWLRSLLHSQARSLANPAPNLPRSRIREYHCWHCTVWRPCGIPRPDCQNSWSQSFVCPTHPQRDHSKRH